jgi:hypothetical protein
VFDETKPPCHLLLISVPPSRAHSILIHPHTLCHRTLGCGRTQATWCGPLAGSDGAQPRDGAICGGESLQLPMDWCRTGASQRALEEEAEMVHMQKPLSISDVDFWHEVGIHLPPERQSEYSRCALPFRFICAVPFRRPARPLCLCTPRNACCPLPPPAFQRALPRACAHSRHSTDRLRPPAGRNRPRLAFSALLGMRIPPHPSDPPRTDRCIAPRHGPQGSNRQCH